MISGTWDPLRHRYVGYGSQAVSDARRLLAEAGYGNGVTVGVKTPTGQPYRAAVILELARQWGLIGVQLTPGYIPTGGTWCPTSPLITGDFQILLHAVVGGPDPDALRPALDSHDIITYDPATCTYNHSDGNFTRLHDVRIDRALESAVVTADQQQRARLYGTVEQRLAHMAYWIPLYYRPALQLANGRLRGLASSQITWPGAAPGWRAEEWHW